MKVVFKRNLKGFALQMSSKILGILRKFCLAFLVGVCLLKSISFADSKPVTVDFDDEDTGVAPAKLMAPAVSPFDELRAGRSRDFLILSAKGSRIVVSVPNAKDEMKIGSILLLKEKVGSREIRFKVTKLSKSKVIATLQDKISNELRNSLMGRTVTLQSSKSTAAE